MWGAKKKTMKFRRPGEPVKTEATIKTEAEAEAEAIDMVKRMHEKHKRELERARLLKYEPMMPAAMDAASYNTKHLRFPCFVQPKLDGCRIRFYHDENGRIYVFSHNNNCKREWTNIGEIVRDILPVKHALEGEFYSSAKRPWQQLNGLFRRKLDPFMDPEFPDLVVYAFDLFVVHGMNDPYHARYKKLKNLLASRDEHNYNNYLVLIENHVVHDAAGIDTLYEKYTKDEGLEGIVVKYPNAFYEPKRTNAVMKRKPVFDSEFTIIDLIEASYGLHVECYDAESNARFGARWDMDSEKAKNKIGKKDTYIGKMITVCYLGKTERGALRSPLVKGIRYD